MKSIRTRIVRPGSRRTVGLLIFALIAAPAVAAGGRNGGTDKASPLEHLARAVANGRDTRILFDEWEKYVKRHPEEHPDVILERVLHRAMGLAERSLRARLEALGAENPRAEDLMEQLEALRLSGTGRSEGSGPRKGLSDVLAQISHAASAVGDLAQQVIDQTGEYEALGAYQSTLQTIGAIGAALAAVAAGGGGGSTGSPPQSPPQGEAGWEGASYPAAQATPPEGAYPGSQAESYPYPESSYPQAGAPPTGYPHPGGGGTPEYGGGYGTAPQPGGAHGAQQPSPYPPPGAYGQPQGGYPSQTPYGQSQPVPAPPAYPAQGTYGMSAPPTYLPPQGGYGPPPPTAHYNPPPQGGSGSVPPPAYPPPQQGGYGQPVQQPQYPPAGAYGPSDGGPGYPPGYGQPGGTPVPAPPPQQPYIAPPAASLGYPYGPVPPASQYPPPAAAGGYGQGYSPPGQGYPQAGNPSFSYPAPQAPGWPKRSGGEGEPARSEGE